MTTDAFWARQRVLVLAPHPDDETFGAGGLMAKVKAAGGQAYVLVGSAGDLNQYGVPDRASVPGAVEVQGAAAGAQTMVAGKTRADELARAMATLGVDGYELLYDDPDMHLRLDAVPIRDLMARIERDAAYAIDRVAPTVLVLPARTFNQDHEAMFKAGFAACRPHLPAHRPFVPVVLSADAPQLGWSVEPFHPNFYVDITAHLETKLRAHACHRSQLRPPPHHASLENVERLARLRGAEISVEAAEAFRCYRVAL